MADKEGVVVGADSTATYEPVVQLQEVETDTGESNEDIIYTQRCMILRFASECDPPLWKERGKGDIKFLRHKDTKAIRAVMRQEKTLKLILNHIINPQFDLKSNQGSDRFWSWRATDFALDQPVTDTLGIKLKNAEVANEYKAKWDYCRQQNEGRKIVKTTALPVSPRQPAQPVSSPPPSAVSSPPVLQPAQAQWSFGTPVPANPASSPIAQRKETETKKEEGKKEEGKKEEGKKEGKKKKKIIKKIKVVKKKDGTKVVVGTVSQPSPAPAAASASTPSAAASAPSAAAPTGEVKKKKKVKKIIKKKVVVGAGGGAGAGASPTAPKQ